MYGPCDKPGPDKEDIVAIVQVLPTRLPTFSLPILLPAVCWCCSSGVIVYAAQHKVDLLQSGDGFVTKCENPSSALTKAITRGCQLAVMSTDKIATDPGVKQLLKAKVPCASAQFLIEWLAHPQQDLTDYVLFGSRVEWAPELEMAAMSRMAAVRPHQMSPQI